MVIGEHEFYVNQEAMNESKNERQELINSKCYITTACMKRFQKQYNDKCYELTILRWYRDNFIPKEEICHYYEIAPIIVEALEKNEHAKEIYSRIYDDVVYYCVRQIENGNFESAHNRYKDSLQFLEEQFARPVLEERLVKVLKLSKQK